MEGNEDLDNDFNKIEQAKDFMDTDQQHLLNSLIKEAVFQSEKILLNSRKRINSQEINDEERQPNLSNKKSHLSNVNSKLTKHGNDVTDNISVNRRERPELKFEKGDKAPYTLTVHRISENDEPSKPLPVLQVSHLLTQIGIKFAKIESITRRS